VTDRTYELLFIARPGLAEPEVEALTETVKGYLEKEGGTIEKVEPWGKKRLAYEIDKQREGYYVLIVFASKGDIVKEVERRLKVTDGIVRHITVRVDEDLRRAESRKKRRADHETKKKQRQAAKRTAVESPAP
jgi:small subunit ribosomal protein S6